MTIINYYNSRLEIFNNKILKYNIVKKYNKTTYPLKKKIIKQLK
jgi:hypothetical protein